MYSRWPDVGRCMAFLNPENKLFGLLMGCSWSVMCSLVSGSAVKKIHCFFPLTNLFIHMFIYFLADNEVFRLLASVQHDTVETSAIDKSHLLHVAGILRLFLSSVNYQAGSGFNEAGQRPALVREDVESDHTLFQLLALSPPSGAHELWICFNPWWPQPEGPCKRPTNQLLRPDRRRLRWGSRTISRDETVFVGQIANSSIWWTTLISQRGWIGPPLPTLRW